jgi:hypothetical protein
MQVKLSFEDPMLKDVISQNRDAVRHKGARVLSVCYGMPHLLPMQ